MPNTVFGLPTHVLLIHAVVVLVPLTCLAVVLHAAWPTARRRLGIVTPALALISLVLVPITTHAGEFLERHISVGPTIASKIDAHETLGNHLIYYVAPLFVLALLLWALGRYLDGASVPGVASAAADGETRAVPSWLSYTAIVVALGLAIATSIQLYRIGDAGAHAVWDGVVH